MKCKNCGHEIYSKLMCVVNGGKVKIWKHKNGGTYCKVEAQFPKLGKCLCNQPEPIEED